MLNICKGDRMKKLERLVRDFRNAIDSARDDDRFLRLAPFNRFPRECCGHASDLLCQYLLEHGIKTSLVNGVCKEDRNWHHVWLETEDGIVIDITCDQFIGRFVTEEEAESVHVGGEGIVHRIFSVNRETEDQTIFTEPDKYTGFGGRPNPYQERLIEIDKIIREYL